MTVNSDFDKLVEFFKNQTEKWGEFSVHDTDPLTFTATLTEDKNKIWKIRELMAKSYDGDFEELWNGLVEAINS